MLRILLQARFLPLLAALFALFLGSTAWAQTSGELKGTVADPDGLGVPGVDVTISSDVLIGGAQTRSTDENGYFVFVELPPGIYRMNAEKAGFKGVTVTGIVVQVGRATTQNLTMEVGEAAQEITVEGKRPTVNVEETTHGEVLTKEFLEKIPTGRSYQSAVQNVSGVVGGVGGNPNMGGGAYNENTYMLDGVNITDPVTGTFSLNFNYDAIQQIEVLLGGYEPEYQVSLGGVINIVTESGTNNLEFDTSIYYQNGNWAPKMDARYAADGLNIAVTGFDSSFEIIQVGAKVSGPVIRDRAWFILSYQLDRSLISLTGIPQPRDYEGNYVLSKLTVQPSAEHRLTALLQMNPTTIDNIDQSSIYQDPDSQGRQAQGGYVSQLRWQWFLSPNLNADTMVFVQKEYIEQGPVPCTHDRRLGYNPCAPDEQEGFLDWETPSHIGVNGAYNKVNWGSFYFDDRFRYSASTKVSALGITDPLGGTHDFKVGVQADQVVWDQIQGYSGNLLFIDHNAVYYDPQTYESYYWLEITGPIKFRTSGSTWAWFAQDAYKPISNLTIKYGVRYDHALLRNDIGEPVIVAGLFGPRAYAAWDPFGDQKTKIAGGYGRFNDLGRLDVASFTSVSSYGSKLYLGEAFEDDTRGFLNTQSYMYDYGPLENTNFQNDVLRTPRQDELVLLLQRELIEDVSVGSNVSYKMTRYLYEPDEVDLIYDGDGSNIIGSRDGDPTVGRFRLRTPELAKRDYFQTDVYLDKVESRRWAGRVTYTYTRSAGTSPYSLSGSFINDPQYQYAYGPFYDTDLTHVVKGYAYWSLPTDPWVQTFGLQAQYYSGNRQERYYYADDYGSAGTGSYSLRIRPRGIYTRLPAWWFLSLKFQQEFDVRKGKVVADIELTNITNNQAVVEIYDYYIAAANRSVAYIRQDPLRVQLGLRYVF